MGPIKTRCLEHFQKTDTVNWSKYRVKVVQSHKPMMAKVGLIAIMGESSIPIRSQNIFFTLHLAKRKVNYFLLTFHKTSRLLVGIRRGDCKHQIDMILKVLEIILNFSRKSHRLGSFLDCMGFQSYIAEENSRHRHQYLLSKLKLGRSGNHTSFLKQIQKHQ